MPSSLFITAPRAKALSLLGLFVMAFVVVLPLHMAHSHHCSAEDIEIHQHHDEHPDFEFTTVNLWAPLVASAPPTSATVDFHVDIVRAVAVIDGFLYKQGHFEQQRLRGPPLA
ncbi:MAG: hypothetical protein H8E25_14110 [Planctomycetes bacterium]|nr:hypothetical protein [Planctomycetota bacterium]